MLDNIPIPNDLKARNQLILELAEQMSYAEIGRRLGLSRERIRQIASREAKKHNLHLKNSREFYRSLLPKTLDVIAEYQNQRGYIPSQNEIALKIGVPQPTVSRIIRRLKKAGALADLHGARLYVINNLPENSTDDEGRNGYESE